MVTAPLIAVGTFFCTWTLMAFQAFAAGMHVTSLAEYETQFGPNQAVMATSDSEKTYIWERDNFVSIYLTVDESGQVVAEGRGCRSRGLNPSELPQPGFLASAKVISTERKGGQYSWRIVETLSNGAKVFKAYDGGRLFAVTLRYGTATIGSRKPLPPTSNPTQNQMTVLQYRPESVRSYIAKYGERLQPQIPQGVDRESDTTNAIYPWYGRPLRGKPQYRTLRFLRVDSEERVVGESVAFEDPIDVSIPDYEIPQTDFLTRKPQVKRHQRYSHGFTNVGTDEVPDWRESYTTIETFEDGSRLRRYYRSGWLAEATFFYSKAAIEAQRIRPTPPPSPLDIDEGFK